MYDYDDGTIFVLINTNDRDFSIEVDEIEFKTLSDIGLISQTE